MWECLQSKLRSNGARNSSFLLKFHHVLSIPAAKKVEMWVMRVRWQGTWIKSHMDVCVCLEGSGNESFSYVSHSNNAIRDIAIVTSFQGDEEFSLQYFYLIFALPLIQKSIYQIKNSKNGTLGWKNVTMSVHVKAIHLWKHQSKILHISFNGRGEFDLANAKLYLFYWDGVARWTLQ